MLLLDGFLLMKSLGGLQGNHHALFSVQPVAGEALFGKGVHPVGGVGHPVAPFPAPAAFPDLAEHHEMVLLPMQDGGQGALLAQLLQAHFEGRALHADFLQRMADARHAHPLPREVREGAQVGKGVLLSVGGGHHADASGAAVHLVKLTGESNFHLLAYTII